MVEAWAWWWSRWRRRGRGRGRREVEGRSFLVGCVESWGVKRWGGGFGVVLLVVGSDV